MKLTLILLLFISFTVAQANPVICTFVHTFDGDNTKGTIKVTAEVKSNSTEASYFFGQSSFSIFHSFDFDVINYISKKLSEKNEKISGNYKGIRRGDINNRIILKVHEGAFVDNIITASSDDEWSFGFVDRPPLVDIEYKLKNLSCKRSVKKTKD